MALDIRIKYCEGIVKSYNRDLVLLGNSHCGNIVKLTKECCELIDDCISKNAIVNEYFSAYDSEDQAFMYKLINLLMERKIVLDVEDKEYEELDSEKELMFQFTQKCNLRCIHCCIDCSPECQVEELTTEEWKAVIDKSVGLKLKGVTITGGEPMVRPDFFELAEYAKDKLKVKMQLMTNGTLINENNVDRLIKIFDNFSISVDGADEESCSIIRGKGVFDKVIYAVKLLQSKGMDKIALSYTLMKPNYDKREKFKELTKELGVKSMFRRFETVGRGEDNMSDLMVFSEEFKFEPVICSELDDEKKDSYKPNQMPNGLACGAIIHRLYIGSEGNIYPCQVLLSPEFILGNVKEIDSLNDYWNNGEIDKTEGYKLFFDIHTMYSKDCKNCPSKMYCSSCVNDIYAMKKREDKDFWCNRKREGLARVWN